MEMMRHQHSCSRLSAQFHVDIQNTRHHETMATMEQYGSSMIAAAKD